MNDTKAAIRVENKTIPESTKAKLLGVDKNITMEDHIRSIKSTHFVGQQTKCSCENNKILR